MEIISEILELLNKKIKKKEIIYDFQVNRIEFVFTNNKIIIYNYHNLQQNILYYELIMRNNNGQIINKIIDQKDQVFGQIKEIFDYIEEDHFHSNTVLQEIKKDLENFDTNNGGSDTTNPVIDSSKIAPIGDVCDGFIVID